MTQLIISLILTDDRRQRARLRLILMVAGVYAMSLMAQWHAVVRGMAQAQDVRWLVWFIVIGVTGFYAVVRSGVTRNLSDPALALPQMVFGIVGIAIAYHANPLVRGALPMLAGLVIMFGAFSLSPRQARLLGWFAIAVFGCTIAWGVLREPTVFVPIIESHHFLFVTVVMLTMSELTVQFSRLRSSWRKQNRDLKEAMERLAEGQQVLEQAKAAAESANAAKSQFLANTSHEIRTPLNGILGMNELLMSSPLQPEQYAWASAARASGQHLMSVINDILDFSRIESGNLALEAFDFDLRAVVQDVVTMLEQPARAKGLQLTADIAPPELDLSVKGDPLRLRQVLTNLVGNAIKFTHHGTVAIRVHAQPTVSGAVRMRIAIEDTGIGIGAAAQQRIFDNFSQADGSTTRQYGGSGLGLAICRRLLDQMGGTIGVRSVVGSGSAFEVDLQLPAADAPVGAAQPAPVAMLVAPHVPASNHPPAQVLAGDGAPTDLRPLRGKLLLVEDNPVNQQVGLAMLNRLGLTVDVAENGAQALEKVQTTGYDLVLMDCQMPVMDGFAATAYIRQLPNEGLRSLTIVALTANTMPGDEQRCLDAGMDAFIPKPMSLESLQATLSRWLAR